MRCLIGLDDRALADMRHHRPCGRDLPEVSLEVVGRFVLPQIEDHVDAFDEHGVSVGIEIAEGFGIRQQSARADAEIKTALQHVVEHGDLTGDGGRMAVGKIDGAGSETDGACFIGEAGHEGDAGRDILGQIGRMFADIVFKESQRLGEKKGFPVLAQRLGHRFADRMDGHSKK